MAPTPPFKKLKILNKDQLEDVVENFSDLSELEDDEDSDNEIVSNSSTYSMNLNDENMIEKRLEELFCIAELVEAHPIHEDKSELTQDVGESIQEVLQSDVCFPSHALSSSASDIPLNSITSSQMSSACFVGSNEEQPPIKQGFQKTNSNLLSEQSGYFLPSTSKSPASKIRILSQTIIKPGQEPTLPAITAKFSMPTTLASSNLLADSNLFKEKTVMSSIKVQSTPSTSTSMQTVQLLTTELNSPALVQRTKTLVPNSSIRNVSREWKSVKSIHEVPNFDRKFQPVTEYTHKTQPVDIFLNFFPESLFNSLVTETNLYAAQNKSKGWTDTTVEELKAYFGILLMMGLNPLPDVDLYWSSDTFYNNPDISSVLTRTRYKKIAENFHLRDNSKAPSRDSPSYDKLYKVRTVSNILNETFQKQTLNSSKQSIDECMVKFKGRSSLKQYMPMKPIKRGFKIWARCDAVTGYLYQFEIYSGKGDNTDNEGLGYNVVWKLCQNVPPNTLVAFDNFFTGVNLMDDLFHNGIYAVGTVRTNRKDLPEIIKNPDKKNKLKKNEFTSITSGPISAIKWLDTREVSVLTTAHHPTDVTTVKRTQKDGSKKDTFIPRAIAAYTLTMGGVDHFDHFRSSYPINRKSRKFWWRLFLFMFDAAVINAYITYTSIHNARVHSHRQFRLRLARGMVNGFTCKKRQLIPFKNKKPGGYGVPDEIRLMNVGVHMPIKDNSYKRCRLCSTKEKEKRTNIKCSHCNVSLCAQVCFKNFHFSV